MEEFSPTTIIGSNYLLNSKAIKRVCVGTDVKQSKHFILPDQYNEALEYVKDFWKEEETFEDGEYLFCIKSDHVNYLRNQIYKIEKGWIYKRNEGNK